MDNLFRINKATLDDIGAAIKEVKNSDLSIPVSDVADNIRSFKETSSTADTVFEGETFVGADGLSTGTFTIQEELTEQERLIEELEKAIINKAFDVEPLGRLDITENGVYPVAGYTSVDVKTENKTPQTKTVHFGKNETFSIEPDEGYHLTRVDVTAAVQPQTVLYDYSNKGLDLYCNRAIQMTPDGSIKCTSGFDRLLKSTHKLKVLPLTLEAVIDVPTIKYPADQYWGDIIACNNDAKYSDAFLWDLKEDQTDKENLKIDSRIVAARRLLDGNTTECICIIPDCLTAYRGQRVHVAVVIDTDNKIVNFYLNGQLLKSSASGDFKFSKTGNTTADINGFIHTFSNLDLKRLSYLTIGGDTREMIPFVEGSSWWSVWGTDNYRYFRGSINKIFAFSDVRTANEILTDYNGFDWNREGLLFYYDPNLNIEGSEGLAYRLNADGMSYSVSLGECAAEDIIIPPYYEGLPVTVVDSSNSGLASAGNRNSLTIPHTIKHVHGFYYASGSPIYCYFDSLYLPCTVSEWCQGDVQQFGGISDSIWSAGNNIYMNGELIPSDTLEIPEGVTNVKENAFWLPSGTISKVVLPTTIKTIESKTFANTCVVVKSANPPILASDAFVENVTIQIPVEYKSAYENATNWVIYSSSISYKEGLL